MGRNGIAEISLDRDDSTHSHDSSVLTEEKKRKNSRKRKKRKRETERKRERRDGRKEREGREQGNDKTIKEWKRVFE